MTPLADGPRESAEAKALTEQCGIGTKVLRNARKCLGITVIRQGSGAQMRSVWALPDQVHAVAGWHDEESNAGVDADAIRAPA